MNTMVGFTAITNAEGISIDVVAVEYSGTVVNVCVPEGITIITLSSFWSNENNNHTMKRIFLPKGMEKLHGSAFRRCFELEEVFIPASVEEIVPDAFAINNFWQDPHRPFKKLYVEPGSYAENFAISNSIAYDYIHRADVDWDEEPASVWKTACTVTASHNCGKTVTIPEGVTVIAQDAFAGNETLESVTMPESLEEIGWGAFSGCKKLRSVLELEKTKITEIPNSTFRDCEQLESVILPPQIKEIGDGAFYNCYSLRSLPLPASVQTIGATAFWACLSLKELDIPASCTKIGNYALAAPGLEKIVVPASVTEIGINILPPPNNRLSIYCEAGSAIARIAKTANHRVQFMGELPVPTAGEPKEALFNTLFREATAKLDESEFCYVQDASVQDFQAADVAAYQAAANTLESYFDVAAIWQTIQRKDSLDSLYELHAIPAIAIALAIKLYICPEAGITLCFEFGKHSRQKRWWVCAPGQLTGQWFQSKIGYLNYLRSGSQPKQFRRHYNIQAMRFPTAPDAEITIEGKNFSYLTFSKFGIQNGTLQLLEDYIGKNGGIVKETITKKRTM